jgi:hypothetical protein
MNCPLLPLLCCRLQLASAACCMTGQPTYQGSEVRFEGIPTCSDGPCSDTNFNYFKKGAVESTNKDACCDREDTNSFFYNPQPGKGKWPGKARHKSQLLTAMGQQSCLGCSKILAVSLYIRAAGVSKLLGAAASCSGQSSALTLRGAIIALPACQLLEKLHC